MGNNHSIKIFTRFHYLRCDQIKCILLTLLFENKNFKQLGVSAAQGCNP